MHRSTLLGLALFVFTTACTSASDARTTSPTTSPTATSSSVSPSASPPGESPAAEPKPVPTPTAAPDSAPAPAPMPTATATATATAALPTCDPALDVLDVRSALRKRRALHGRTVSIEGTLHPVSRGCTEEGCGNTCRFAVELFASGAAPSSSKFFSLREDSRPYNHAFECTADAGDPCKGSGTASPTSTEPPCAASLPTTPVVATGVLSTDDDLGAECSPACNDPRILAHVRLCVPS